MQSHIKKITALFLVSVLLIALTACGPQPTQVPSEGIIIKKTDAVELGTPATTLNPEDVYSKITYTPEMFYGDYNLKGGTEERDAYAKDANYLPYTIEGENRMLTDVPIGFKAGRHNLQHKLTYAADQNWAQVSFMRRTDSGSYVLDYFYSAYSIEGNKLIIRPLDAFQIDDASGKVSYDFSDVVMEYTFAFKGRTLTLTNGSTSIDLTGGLEAYGKFDFFSADAYPSTGIWLNDIKNIDFLYNAEEPSYNRAAFRNAEQDYFGKSVIKLEENGLITMTVANDAVQTTYQFVYFYCNEDGIILTDGTNTYYYNYDHTDFNKGEINKYISEENADLLNALDENAAEKIVEKTEDLYADLAKAFGDAGIQITIDKKNGELAVDSSILFGGDSAELSEDGKAFLNKFVTVYTSVVYSEKYNGFVKKTRVEGHTAPLQNSTYESGLPLSEQRAENVKAYCLSAENADASKLANSLEAVGLSNSKPVLDASGNPDLTASRRVSFRFIINLE